MVATDSGRHRYQVTFDVELLYGGDVYLLIHFYLSVFILIIVRGDRDSRATLMPIYGDLYQIKL